MYIYMYIYIYIYIIELLLRFNLSLWGFKRVEL
jgi:hypothetical protein